MSPRDDKGTSKEKLQRELPSFGRADRQPLFAADPRNAAKSKFGIGRAVRRVEDQRFTTGSGQFVADLSLPRQCYGVCVLSPHAHAVIKRIDVSAAKAAPGVLAVLTGADAAADKIGGIPPFFMPDSWGGPAGFSTIRAVLLGDRVRCIGDRVAFVVAETEAQARDASELIAVDYEPLPAVVDLEQAAQPSAPKVWELCPHGNVAATIAFGDKGATDAAFAQAKHVASVRLICPITRRRITTTTAATSRS